MAYSTRALMESVWGHTNIAKWADANNNGSIPQTLNRINTAISASDAKIDDRLRGRGYVIPFNPVPVTIQMLSARLAGVWLYENPRGLTDGDDTSSAVLETKEQCEIELTNIHARLIRLDAAQVGGQVPVVFKDTEPYAGDTRA